MMSDYKRLANEIINAIGGADNVQGVNYCATRLRITLNDARKIKKDVIEHLDGVLGTVVHQNEYQVVIGTDVASVYNAFINQISNNHSKEKYVKPETIKQKITIKSALEKTVDFISGTFVPILAILVAAGLISAVLNIGVTFFHLSSSGGTYKILYAVYEAGYFFLPLYLGYSAARKLNISPMMGAFLGAVLVYKTIDGAKGLSIFGLSVPQITYDTSVIPIILGVLFMAIIDKGLDHIIPKSIKFFIKPLVTMLIIVPITLLWLGPLGYQLGTVIAAGLGFVNTHLGWFSVGLMGAVTPLLVMTGTNQALFPLVFASLAANGYDAFVMPGMLAANVAVGASALAVSLTTKKTDDRALALSAGLTGVMGITEPSIFGVLIKNRRALISAIISGGIGGMIAGLVDLRQYAIVSPGIAAIPTFIPTNGKGLTSNFWMSILVLMISISLGFVITFILQKRFLKDYKEEQFTLPVNGKVIPLADVKDDVFSKGMVGDGIAIEPENGIICSPIAGTIIMIAPTKHAIGLRSNKGIEVLLHLGLDTVEMREAPFQIKVKKGDRVLANQELAIMDLDKVKNAGKDPIIIMILTSKDKHLSHIDYSKSKVGDRLGLLPS